MGAFSLEHKTLALQLKAETPGSFRAVFSTLNVIDKDGDVTLPGAFEKDAPVNIAAWGHNWGDLPSGDGKIAEEGEEAIIAGAFYLGTPQGDATYETLKQRFERGTIDQEWSYGFQVVESDFGTFQGREVRFLKRLKVFEVSPVMVGAGENTRTLDVKGMTFTDHGDEVASALSAFVERTKSRADFRAKEGRVLSAANRIRLAALVEQMATARQELAELLDATDPEKGQREIEHVYLEFMRNQALSVN
jgi:hypothetical protein